jgi:hypothetical protein
MGRGKREWAVHARKKEGGGREGLLAGPGCKKRRRRGKRGRGWAARGEEERERRGGGQLGWAHRRREGEGNRKKKNKCL